MKDKTTIQIKKEVLQELKKAKDRTTKIINSDSAVQQMVSIFEKAMLRTAKSKELKTAIRKKFSFKNDKQNNNSN